MPNPIGILSVLLFAPGSACAPYATRVLKGLRQTTTSLPGPSFSQLPCQVDYLFRSSSCSAYQSLRTPRSDLLESRVLATRRKAISIVVPLICVLSVLLILLILKGLYLKQRRLQTIHDLPNLLAVLHEECSQDNENERSLPLSGHFQHATDIPSVRSRFSRQVSRKSGPSSSENETPSCNRRYPDSAPGILVGMLGSPDWETNMQRELANHQWRLRRESQTLSLKSQNRSTWHSQHSHPRSRNSTIRSRSESGSRNDSVRRPGRRSSLRIPHASSFGELYSDTFRNKGLRPKSFNAAIDQMSSSRSGSSIPCQSDSRRNSHSGANAFSVPGSLGQRPSTIREVDTPPSTLPLIQEGTLRLQVLDYGDSTPAVNVGPVSSASDSSGSRMGSLGSRLDSTNTEVSDAYERLNASRESRTGASWRQLPHFPSPPATPSPLMLAAPHISEPVRVNTVRVEPSYFDQLYGIVTDLNSENPEPDHDIRLVGKDYCRITTQNTSGSYSPLTLDFGSLDLSDMLATDLLDVGSHSAKDAQNRSVGTVKPPPRALTPELGTECLTVLGQHAHFAEKHMGSGLLSPFSAAAQNRHHLRVRDHVPFSLVALPPAYLRNPRPLERTVRFTFGDEPVQNQLNGQTPFRHVASSLVDLSAPVRPSPLRRVASMGSINSSRTSSRATRAPGDVSQASYASSNSITQHSGFALIEDANLAHDPREVESSEATEQQILNVHTLRPMASNASLFLDLGGSSTGYDEEPSDLYSFDVVDFVAADHFFQHPQASSSEVIAAMTGRLDEDIEYITEVHSESFHDT